MTNNISRRALEHKRGEVEGFASKYHCNRLVYYASFEGVHKAIGHEKQLKGWIGAKKIALIKAKNPRSEDLAEKRGSQMAFAGEAIKGMRELLDTPLPGYARMGCFDRVSVRFTNGNSLR
jgi:putative endonuclease